MSGSFLFGPGIRRLQAALTAREQLQSIHASNIANAEVPGYKADARSFEDIYRLYSQQATGELARTHVKHMDVAAAARPRAETFKHDGKAQRLDGNTVDMQREMEAMAENQLMHELTLRLLGKRLAGIKNAIKEGR